jgi:2-polyprenylphenol 6-hydroxylase
MDKVFDIVVLGTGVVGLAATVALSRLGYQVALVGPQALTPASVDASVFDTRVYALAPSTQTFLESLGVWSELNRSRLAPMYDIRVFQGELSQALEFNSAQVHLDRLATVVEHAELSRALNTAVSFSSAQRFQNVAKLIDLTSANPIIELEHGVKLTTKLVVGADGASSLVRDASNISFTQTQYPQSAIIANFYCELPHHGMAHQWFVPEGVIALLPLPDEQHTSFGVRHRVSLVWSAPHALAEQLMSLSNEQLAARVGQVSLLTLGFIWACGEAKQVALSNLLAQRLIAPAVVLVGDSAHVIHPMAGHGLNLGFGDVAELVRVLGSERHTNPSDPQLLRQYERARREPIAVMRGVTDGLFKLHYGVNNTQAPTVKLVRELGWRAIAKMPWLRSKIIEHASKN